MAVTAYSRLCEKMDAYQTLLTISGSLLSIAVSARIAISSYLKQREYELVKERYLEGSVDLLASALNEQISRHSQNWGRCLHIVRQFRERRANFNLENFEFNLIEIYTANFNVIAHYRLQEIIGSEVVWKAYQLAFAFFASADTFMRDELKKILQDKSRKDISEKERSEIVKIATDELIRQSKECEKHFLTLKALSDVARFLEKEKFTFKKLHKIKNQKEIKETIKIITVTFKEE